LRGKSTRYHGVNQLVVTGRTNSLSRGESPRCHGSWWEAHRCPPCGSICRCCCTMSGEPKPKRARVPESCWLCSSKIEWSDDQPISLKNRVQTFWLHYNCRWSKRGELWVQRTYLLQDADTNEYITPQCHPPWLVREIRLREQISGKQPQTHPL
jgi:hypothetical protein